MKIMEVTFAKEYSAILKDLLHYLGLMFYSSLSLCAFVVKNSSIFFVLICLICVILCSILSLSLHLFYLTRNKT